jgi:hypothetical protein
MIIIIIIIADTAQKNKQQKNKKYDEDYTQIIIKITSSQNK